jgi:hypothetical protein
MDAKAWNGDDNTTAADLTDAERDERLNELLDDIESGDTPVSTLGPAGLQELADLQNGVAAADTRFVLIYPERRMISGSRLIGWAKDYLATEYMRANPHADDAAIEENARVRTVGEAIELLEDAGVITLAK